MAWGERLVLDQVDLTLQPGERVAVRFAEVDASGDSCTSESQPASR